MEVSKRFRLSFRFRIAANGDAQAIRVATSLRRSFLFHDVENGGRTEGDLVATTDAAHLISVILLKVATCHTPLSRTKTFDDESGSPRHSPRPAADIIRGGSVSSEWTRA